MSGTRKGLPLGAGLVLPADAVTQKLAFLGRTGSGKSYAASRLAELLAAIAAQFLVLDPVGIWWALRLAANGTDPGIPLPVFGGLHGDIPLEPTAGALMADLVVDRGLSAVLDVSQMIEAEQARFARAFATRLFQRKKAAPSALHLFIEECQEFVPQNLPKGGGDAPHMLHAFERLVKLGRNFGIGVSLISQRPQEVNKKALNQTECLFAFQMTGKHERKAIADWVDTKGLDVVDLDRVLPGLQVGQPHVWSPQWLGRSQATRISAKWTFDGSATPKVGAKVTDARPLAPLELDQLRTAMAATIERAKAEDPKELRRRIAALERQLAQKTPPPAPEIRTVEKPVVTEAQLKRVESLVDRFVAASDKQADLAGHLEVLGREFAGVLRQATAPAAPPSISTFRNSAISQSRPAPQVPRTPRAAPAGGKADSAVSGAQQRVLNALAWLEQVGIEAPDKIQAALFAQLKPGAGHTNNTFGGLRSAGLVEYPTAGSLALTPAGRALADPGTVPQSAAEMHQQLYRSLSKAQAALLEVLIGVYPHAEEKEAVARAAGLTPGAGHTNNSFGRLRSLGLIDYPSPGEAVARPVLFLEAR